MSGEIGLFPYKVIEVPRDFYGDASGVLTFDPRLVNYAQGRINSRYAVVQIGIGALRSPTNTVVGGRIPSHSKAIASPLF